MIYHWIDRFLSFETV